MVTTAVFVFVSLTFSFHITNQQRLEAVEMGNRAVVHIVRQLLGLWGPGKDGVHHLEPSVLSHIVSVEDEGERETVHPR